MSNNNLYRIRLLDEIKELQINPKGEHSNLTPPICSEIHPATFNFASILAAAIPWPLPLKRF
jgi:hypothetical protein